VFHLNYTFTSFNIKRKLDPFCGLSLHPDKTRLIEFGRDAAAHARRRGEKKPATFDFLGLTHICARSRRGRFTIHVRTMRKRLHRSFKRITQDGRGQERSLAMTTIRR
jgi:hypothetical protein